MAPRPLHMFMYGPLRTGKTTYGATFPNPVFLSTKSEGGSMSLRGTNVDVIEIGSTQDMKDAVAYIEANGKTKHNWRSVIVDPLTYYSDLFVQEASQNGTKVLQQRDWGLLDLHLQKWLLPKLRSLPYHVLWIANEDEVKDTNGNISHYTPSLYGKSKVKFPGATDLIVRSAKRSVRNSQTNKMETEYFLKTVCTDDSPAGGRFGPIFSDGLLPMHFNAVIQRIGQFIGEELPK